MKIHHWICLSLLTIAFSNEISPNTAVNNNVQEADTHDIQSNGMVNQKGNIAVDNKYVLRSETIKEDATDDASYGDTVEEAPEEDQEEQYSDLVPTAAPTRFRSAFPTPDEPKCLNCYSEWPTIAPTEVTIGILGVQFNEDALHISSIIIILAAIAFVVSAFGFYRHRRSKYGDYVDKNIYELNDSTTHSQRGLLEKPSK